MQRRKAMYFFPLQVFIFTLEKESEMNITSQKLFAGASWKWIEDLSDYPAPEYTLKIFHSCHIHASVNPIWDSFCP